MDTRTWAAVFSGFVIFIASIGFERLCGVYSENCGINWSGFYGTQATYVQINACIDPPSPKTGLGVSMLSVSSLFLALPVVYADLTTRFTAAVSLMLGVGSFLYHANNTGASATVDYLGIVLLGPALFFDIAGVETGPGSDSGGSLPASTYGYPTKFFLWAGFTAILGASIAIRVAVTYYPTLDAYVYVSQSVAAVGIIWLSWRKEIYHRVSLNEASMEGKQTQFRRVPYYGGLALLVAGIITLIVATGTRNDCAGVITELERPHFYGHLLVGAGTTAVAAALFYSGGQQTVSGSYRLL